MGTDVSVDGPRHARKSNPAMAPNMAVLLFAFTKAILGYSKSSGIVISLVCPNPL